MNVVTHVTIVQMDATTVSIVLKDTTYTKTPVLIHVQMVTTETSTILCVTNVTKPVVPVSMVKMSPH